MHHQWLPLGLVPVGGWQPNHLLQKQEKTSSGKLEEQLKEDNQWSLIAMAALYRRVLSRGSQSKELTCWLDSHLLLSGEKVIQVLSTPLQLSLSLGCQSKIKNEKHVFNINEKCNKCSLLATGRL